MVGVYEPYVEVCRRLAELSPCAGSEQKSLLLNSGAEAVENAVKIARSATGRPAVVVFDNAFHGRTLLTMTMTAKVKPYKAGFGPFAPEVYRAPVPNPYRGITTDDAIAGLKQLFKADVDPATVACVRARAGAGRGRLPADAARLPAAPAGAVPRARDPLRRRRGAVRRRPHREDVGGRALRRRRARPARLAASRSAAACRSRPSPGRAELMDAVPPGGLGGTFGGNPLSCAAAIAVLDAVAEPEFLAEATRARRRCCGRGSRRCRPSTTRSATCAASARCSRSSSPSRRRSRRRRSSPRRSSAGCCCSRAGCTAT